MKWLRMTPCLGLLWLGSCSTITTVFGEREQAALEGPDVEQAFSFPADRLGHSSLAPWLHLPGSDLDHAPQLREAMVQLSREAPGRAAILLQKLLADPQLGVLLSDHVVALHAWALLQDGDPAAAQVAAREGVQRFGTTPSLVFVSAAIQEAEGEAMQALSGYRQLLNLLENEPFTLRACARTAIAAEDGLEALVHLDRLMVVEPLDLEHRMLRVEALYGAGRFAEGLALTQQLVAEFPQDFPLRAELVTRSHLAAVATGQADTYLQTLPLLEDLAELAPQRADVFLMLGSSHLFLGGRNEAKEAFDRCLEVEPKQVEAGLAYAALLAEDREFEAAGEILLSLLRQPILAQEVEQVQQRMLELVRLQEEG